MKPELSSRLIKNVNTRTRRLMSKPDKVIDFEHIMELARFVAAQARQNVLSVRHHAQILKDRGDSEWRLNELERWRTSPAFTEREKTALGLSEAVSLKQSKEISGKALSETRRYFSMDEIVSLTLAIMAMNDLLDLHSTPHSRVLIVEDDPNDQDLLRRQLSEIHIADNVIFVPDAHQALVLLEGCRKGVIDWKLLAVFLDLNLPGMNGIELLKRIRTMPEMEGLPVIVMTSSDHPGHIEECHRLQVSSYVQKPVTSSSFSKAIANIFHLPSEHVVRCRAETGSG